MTKEQLINLIFLPGFSTAKEITETSGRGVGMDVVKTKITALGGTVHIDSQVGKGTRTTIKLPITLAIIQAILVTDTQRNIRHTHKPSLRNRPRQKIRRSKTGQNRRYRCPRPRYPHDAPAQTACIFQNQTKKNLNSSSSTWVTKTQRWL